MAPSSFQISNIFKVPAGRRKSLFYIIQIPQVWKFGEESGSFKTPLIGDEESRRSTHARMDDKGLVNTADGEHRRSADELQLGSLSLLACVSGLERTSHQPDSHAKRVAFLHPAKPSTVLECTYKKDRSTAPPKQGDAWLAI